MPDMAPLRARLACGPAIGQWKEVFVEFLLDKAKALSKGREWIVQFLRQQSPF